MSDRVPGLAVLEVVGLSSSGNGHDVYLRVRSEAGGIVGRMSFCVRCRWEVLPGEYFRLGTIGIDLRRVYES